MVKRTDEMKLDVPTFINPGFQDDEKKAIEANGHTNGAVANGAAHNHPPMELKPVVDHDESSPTIERGQWGSKAEFILSCIGLSVGIGNIWRFPFLAYQNGGGAFLLPYVILMLLVGKPMYFMEVAVGQFTSLGPMSMWRCLPIAKGVGAAMVVVSLIVAVYYNVILAYTVFYMAQSFRSVLPWEDCFEWWGADPETCYVRTNNVERCVSVEGNLVREYMNITNVTNGVLIVANNLTAVVPTDVFTSRYDNCTNATQTASQQFWERYVLNITSGIEDLGVIRWDLTLCLLASWVVVFLCLMKGVKSTGKVVYFTATFPYLVLIILLVKGVTLPGAVEGIKYFIIPEWHRLLEIDIWRKAAEQLFYSLGISWGGIIMFGSYNKFSNPVHRDALFVSTMDFITSIIGGIVIFSVLGNMSTELGIDIKDVAKAGQGLAFVAYPEALSRLVIPQLWSFLFFFMLFLLGLDSEFALLETFLTAFYDEFPRSRRYKIPLTFGICLLCFLVGLPCVTQGGQYVLNLMDTYAGGGAVLFIAICEIVGLMWFYGVNRFCADLKLMLGHDIGWYWKASWLVFSPCILGFLFIYGLVKHKPIMYDDIVAYPTWADGIGWLLAMLSMAQIPIWGVFILLKNWKNPRKAFQPERKWGPGDPVEMQLYHAHNGGVTNLGFQGSDSYRY
ncbi:sodium-dependent proline transporter [Rhipicephalus sanguineus]|uniref:sodium-dependent proline transporter n=1 Tax=Rhipicephalus sanguineus TaxID=34632 RepID=UPI0018945AF3|nr:sodium-dependent proline transporter [Rhipicephalus sanguineus]